VRPVRVCRGPIRIRRVGRGRRRRLMLRGPVGVRILCDAISRQSGTRGKRENFQTGLEFSAPHFFSALRLPFYRSLHSLRLLRLRIVILRPRRQILQRLKILQHVVIFQHRQILHHRLVVIRDIRRGRCAGAIPEP
jgi:hypothetical protein